MSVSTENDIQVLHQSLSPLWSQQDASAFQSQKLLPLLGSTQDPVCHPRVPREELKNHQFKSKQGLVGRIGVLLSCSTRPLAVLDAKCRLQGGLCSEQGRRKWKSTGGRPSAICPGPLLSMGAPVGLPCRRAWLPWEVTVKQPLEGRAVRAGSRL